MNLDKEEIDYIVLGTGLSESAIGTALAINGDKVCHIDLLDWYGSTLSNFNLSQFVEFVETYWDALNVSKVLQGFSLKDF